jgi:trehalose 6-phosphate synthase/phosphatase
MFRMSKRLFIISNRLPVNVDKVDNDVRLNVSSGGLVTAINSYISYAAEKGINEFTEKYWIGAPGCSSGEWVQAKEKLDASDYEYLPVFINHHVYDLYYNGLSNSVVWPLFHYFPSYAEYKVEYFENYKKANEDFLHVVLRNVKENDVVWIHDYHLFPLAAMIRASYPNLTIGFFLHIPFPSYEIFRMMPDGWQHEILTGILGADLIGFHTIDYASHFLKCLQMVLRIDADINIIKHNNRLIKIDVFPISIDYNKFHLAYNDKEVATRRTFYKKQFAKQKILFSVDRLDYTKGVFSRLKAYQWFLQAYPAYKEQVVFIIVVVPSRDTVLKYSQRKKEIDEFIGNFNSTMGTITWKPVIYQYNHLDFTELMALYTACDMALVTPVRDGMNLVAKEFVSSQQDLKGVLLLSEMAGAARELTEALHVNPNDLEGFAKKIKEGLEMDEKTQALHLSIMQKRIREYDVNAWAEDFFTELKKIKVKQKEFEIMFIDRDTKRLLCETYRVSKKRLLLLDYDGTLVSFAHTPHEAKPDTVLLTLLEQIAKDKNNEVYIISGRDSHTLQTWLGHLPLHIVAEHGAKTKCFNEDWMVDKSINADEAWKDIISQVMAVYVKRCANTFVEQKEYSLVWHFRNAEAQQAKLRSTELYNELCPIAHALNLEVLPGNKIIEVRVKGIDKGYIAKKLIAEKNYDFILACGDDNTDEDMFKILANLAQSHTIKIGDVASYAKYNLHTPQMMVSLLGYLASSKLV